VNTLVYQRETQAHFEQHPPHILVVDDEEFNRRLLHRILSQYCDITEASDGSTAVELVQQHNFDLVILDIMMPGMHGLDALAEIRNHASSTELPVILVSALHENDDIVRGLKAGANDYIPKPIDAEIVQARVMTQLQLKVAFDVQKQAYINLKKADMLKTNLLSIASHDLKSPLSNIYMAEMLLRQLIDSNDPTILSILDTVKMTVNNMNNIIVEFLDMAALQSGKMDIKTESIEIKEVIDEVMKQYVLQAEEKGSRITALETAGIVTADRKRLVQILSNLVSNGLKYSPPNSEIKLNAFDDGDYVVIEVLDQGPGIPEEERNQLFTEFGKLSPRPTSNESSTRLGLWIVKQMVEVMGGQVGVDFPENGGSTFWVRLPAT
jgi:two-component system, sensor histidine kinase and response regulator